MLNPGKFFRLFSTRFIMNKKRIVIGFFGFSVAIIFSLQAYQNMVVTVPLIDLRGSPIAAPQDIKAPALSEDIGSELSQLFMGECLRTQDEGLGDFVKVEAIEQDIWANGAWIPCPGYVNKNHVKMVEKFPAVNAVVVQPLAAVVDEKNSGVVQAQVPFGTCLLVEQQAGDQLLVNVGDVCKGQVRKDAVYVVTPQVTESIGQLRIASVQRALLFLGSFYVWGGRSMYDPAYALCITGLDCSNLIHLIFRSLGLKIPRNSQSQYVKSLPVASGQDLKAGDVIYLSPARAERMCHVLIYIGNEMFIETTGLGFTSAKQTDKPEELTTRMVSAQDYFGKTVAQLTNGLEVNNNKKIYLRTFFGNAEYVQALRDDFFKRD